MSRLTPSSRLPLPAIVVGLAALFTPGALRAQSTAPPKVFYACYVPSSGTTYRIKEVDVKQECAKSTHVQFSWTDGNRSAVSQFFTVTSAAQNMDSFGQKFVAQPCPAGSQLVGGGHRILAYSSPIPLVSRSTPDDDGAAWAVNVINPSTGFVSFTVWARCAK
jgi:hypothetical protein